MGTELPPVCQVGVSGVTQLRIVGLVIDKREGQSERVNLDRLGIDPQLPFTFLVIVMIDRYKAERELCRAYHPRDADHVILRCCTKCRGAPGRLELRNGSDAVVRIIEIGSIEVDHVS